MTRDRAPGGQLRWVLVLDLSADPFGDDHHEVKRLLRDGRLGSSLTVRVGHQDPFPWLVPLLTEVLAAGVDVTVEGSPRYVARWWWAIQRHGRAQLTVVE